MPNTLTPACSFCGLRFASRPLLELHIREDHSGRSPGARPVQPSRTVKEAVPTAPPRPRVRPRRMTTAARRAIGALRYANQELMRASEAMARPLRTPRIGGEPGAAAGEDAHPAGTATGGTATDKAA